MTPESEDALVDQIRAASGPLAIKGGGTRGMDAVGDIVSARKLSGVSLYEPGALTLVAGAGTPVRDVIATLAEHNQRLAFEPMDHCGLLGTTGVPTLGGIVSGNISGPRRISVGAARDFVLGVRFVDGAGNLVKNGGRVMKNVTGYDLVKLMSGAWGTLGVLTEVSLKVLPMPEMANTVSVEAADPVDAVAVMTRAMASPYDVSGAAFDPQMGRVSLRVEGFEEAVRTRSADLARHLKRDIQMIGADATEALWQGIRDVTPFHGADGDVWRVSVKPTDGPAVIAAAQAEATLMDWSGGLVWLRVAPGTDLRARMSGISGHATLVRGSAETKARLGVFEPEPAGLAALTAGLRAKFDPREILNPGLMATAQVA
ncbi:MAG: FAD-binding protein [Paracoccaceae bacterium]